MTSWDSVETPPWAGLSGFHTCVSWRPVPSRDGGGLAHRHCPPQVGERCATLVERPFCAFAGTPIWILFEPNEMVLNGWWDGADPRDILQCRLIRAVTDTDIKGGDRAPVEAELDILQSLPLDRIPSLCPVHPALHDDLDLRLWPGLPPVTLGGLAFHQA